ncbi:MAG: phosphoglucosamine mutase [Synergistaceae bacterium]|nr:phosphoglucosamine mutase [Synergistaceae bacterium]
MDNGRRVLFGTDGVRGIANLGEMTPEMALRLGRSFILFLAERGIPRPRIVTGRDTRRSGTMLEGALSAGMASAGAEVLSVGVMPTPGVSFALTRVSADGGAVISASHNPAEYNGIKLLSRDGCKLSDEDESGIEEYLSDNLTDEWRPTGASIGEIRNLPDMAQTYADHLASQVKQVDSLPRSMLFDCAHGAACVVMPGLIERLGTQWSLTGTKPDGMNINEGVGVIHIGHLAAQVKDLGYGSGFAFDGDADRTLMVDSKGRTIDGDILMWVLARWLKARKDLGAGVVITVMSNMALEERLADEKIKFFRCPVGDRYVMEAMRRNGARLGGEQSGHVIADTYSRTGDGLCTAIMMLNACHELNEDIDTLVDRFGRYPQRLSNLTIANGRDIDMDYVESLSNEAQKDMGGKGRVFIRLSGTEPLLRILVEARDVDLVKEVSEHLTAVLREHCS